MGLPLTCRTAVTGRSYGKRIKRVEFRVRNLVA